MAVDRTFITQTELDLAQGNGELELGGLYLVQETSQFFGGLGNSEVKRLCGDGDTVNFSTVIATSIIADNLTVT